MNGALRDQTPFAILIASRKIGLLLSIALWQCLISRWNRFDMKWFDFDISISGRLSHSFKLVHRKQAFWNEKGK